MTIDPQLLQQSATLPGSISDLIEVIGYPATARLISAMGGLTISAAHHKYLADTLTKAEAKALLDWLGGDTLYIPRCDHALRDARNRRFMAELAQLQAQGQSIRQAMITLCPAFGFSDRYAWTVIRNAAASATSQPPLL